MALLFVDSFDHYTTVLDKWTALQIAGFTPQIAAAGRNGTSGLTLRGGYPYGLRKTIPGGSKATLIAGVALRLVASPAAASQLLIVFGDNNTNQIGVWLTLGQRLEVRRGEGTVLATGNSVLAVGAYYYLEFRATIDPAAGAYTVRLNGAQELTAAGVNTRMSANSSADQVWLGHGGSSGGTMPCDYDDFYVCDSLTAINNDFLGDVRIQAILPDGPGGNTAFTTLVGAATHWQAVNEAPPNDDVSYVASATPGQIDTFTLGDLVPTSGTIKGIQTVLDARKDDGGVRTLQPELRIAAANYLVGAPHNIGNAYGLWIDVVEISPATAVAFTLAEVNGMEAGANLIA